MKCKQAIKKCTSDVFWAFFSSCFILPNMHIAGWFYNCIIQVACRVSQYTEQNQEKHHEKVCLVMLPNSCQTKSREITWKLFPACVKSVKIPRKTTKDYRKKKKSQKDYKTETCHGIRMCFTSHPTRGYILCQPNLNSGGHHMILVCTCWHSIPRTLEKSFHLNFQQQIVYNITTSLCIFCSHFATSKRQ